MRHAPGFNQDNVRARKELREGVNELPTPNTASPDTVRAISPELFFDFLGIRLDSSKAADAAMTLNVDLGEESGQYVLALSNGVLNHTPDLQVDDADATLTLSRDTLNDIILGEVTLEQATESGDLQIDGDADKLGQLVAMLDTFEFWFNIVTPRAL